MSPARPRRRPTDWSTRCWDAPSCSSATTGTSGDWRERRRPCCRETTPGSSLRRSRPGATIGLDPEGAIRVPPGTALDLGSTAKAWTADLIAAAIETELGEPALVSVGGDLRIAAPDGTRWKIAVSEDPAGPVQQHVSMARGGLATSSTRVRRWTHRGAVRHHLLDPRTGRPVDEVWRTVSATGPSCVAANTASTAAVVMGPSAPAWLADRGVAARLKPGRGQVVTTDGWPATGSGPSRRAS